MKNLFEDPKNKDSLTGSPREREPAVKITVLGGQGKFGAALIERLKQMTGNLDITTTTDKNRNEELASKAEIVIITVQPNKVEGVLKEIKSSLKDDASVVSFAFQYPLDSMSEITGKPAARGMADPWWNVSAVFSETGFPEKDLQRIFNGLTKMPTIKLESDKDIDKFTIAISYMLVALLMKRLGTLPNTEKHLEFIAALVGANVKDMDSFIPPGNPSEALTLICTKGGASESVLKALQSEPNIEPQDLFEHISKMFIQNKYE